MVHHKAPAYRKESFNCTHCGAFAQQDWRSLFHYVETGTYKPKIVGSPDPSVINSGVDIATCKVCGQSSLWYQKHRVYPNKSDAPPPNPDLPEDIKADYQEASRISLASPRGAAALLRLAIEKLCKNILGEESQNLNTDISKLVEKGLPVKIQKALDTVRVIGNNAVHAGEISLNEVPETVQSLFKLVNLIADAMITQPKHVDEVFNESLPESVKQSIVKRDQKS